MHFLAIAYVVFSFVQSDHVVARDFKTLWPSQQVSISHSSQELPAALPSRLETQPRGVLLFDAPPHSAYLR
jgi:hypothetical protein